MKSKVLFLVFCGLFVTFYNVYAVELFNTDGDFSDGHLVSISGRDFGMKLTPSPLVWDDFERGVVGAPVGGTAPVVNDLPGKPTWVDNGAKFSSDGLRAGSTRAAKSEFISTWGSGFKIPISQNVLYFTFWYKFAKMGSNYTDNFKPWMYTGSRTGETPIAYSGFGEGPTGKNRNALQDMESLGNSTLWGDMRVNDVEQWVRLEQYIVQSDPNTFNGTYQMWFHRPGLAGVKLDLSGIADMKTRNTSIGYDELNIMPYARLSGSKGSATSESWADDIYIDNTLARVELCDRPSWVDRTVCEIQIPTAWSPSTITFIVNSGSFTSSQVAYLYVVDENGGVNSTGHEVVVGQPNTGTKVILPPPELKIY